MKAEKALLLVAFMLIFVALVAGIAGSNPANPANTNTGTIHTEGANTDSGTVRTQGEFSSADGGFTFTGTSQHK